MRVSPTYIPRPRSSGTTSPSWSVSRKTPPRLRTVEPRTSVAATIGGAVWRTRRARPAGCGTPRSVADQTSRSSHAVPFTVAWPYPSAHRANSRWTRSAEIRWPFVPEEAGLVQPSSSGTPEANDQVLVERDDGELDQWVREGPVGQTDRAIGPRAPARTKRSSSTSRGNQMGARPVVRRTTSCTSITSRKGPAGRPSMMSKSRTTARWPVWKSGWRIVVRPR